MPDRSLLGVLGFLRFLSSGNEDLDFPEDMVT